MEQSSLEIHADNESEKNISLRLINELLDIFDIFQKLVGRKEMLQLLKLKPVLVAISSP